MKVMNKNKEIPILKIINNTLNNSNKFFSIFFYFKLFLLFLYLLGSFQSFTLTTTKLLLRMILSNDIFIIFFGIINIIMNIEGKVIKFKILILINSIFNIIFSLITIFISFTILIFT
jgi:hypothetical protein